MHELWPNLRELTFFNFGPSTLKMIRSVAPHLGDLQGLEKLILPVSVTIPSSSEQKVQKSSLAALAETGLSLPPGLRVETFFETSQAHFFQPRTCQFQGV
jgi:hypothetical protein